MSKKNIAERIEAYLLRKMSDEERTAFELELKSNTVLSNQVAKQREVHAMMEILVEDDLLGKMKQWDLNRKKLQKKEKIAINTYKASYMATQLY